MKKYLLIMAAMLLLTGCGTSAAVEDAVAEEAAEQTIDTETIEDTAEDSAAAENSDTTEDSEPVELTGEFASFTSMDLDGNEVNQSIISEADLTILNIWGTFCGPCISEMPDLGELADEYADK